MNESLISIVVPIYNVEDYLNECIYSLINQTYKNIEIILVDDGSTDNSGNIADGLSKIDSRINVYHKNNGGLSDARNFGIEHSKGKYICFVDSDDYVKEDYVESMYTNLVQNKTKISCCGFCHLYENDVVKEINFQNIKNKFVGDEAQIYLNIIGYYNVSSCNKLFDIDLFKNIRFPVGKKSEDWFIMYLLFEKAHAIYYNSDSKYIYRQRMGSITKNSSANLDSIKAAKQVYEYFENNENVSSYAAQSLAFAIIGVYNYELCRGVKQKDLDIFYKEFKLIRRNVIYNYLSFSRKIQLFLFANFKLLYNFVFKIFDLRRKIKYEK